MSGGPDDGANLYPEDTTPCLVCGRAVGVDFDGVATWHLKPLPPYMQTWMPIRPFGEWCTGSRTSLDVPDAA